MRVIIEIILSTIFNLVAVTIILFTIAVLIIMVTLKVDTAKEIGNDNLADKIEKIEKDSTLTAEDKMDSIYKIIYKP